MVQVKRQTKQVLLLNIFEYFNWFLFI
jgi:hypothetical protein